MTKKLTEAIGLASEKSSQTRINALKDIASILSTVYMPELIDNYKITILDIVEKSIRRGKGEEQSYAAQIAPMLVFHVDNCNVVEVMTPLLRHEMLNEAAPFETRSKCCTALALLQVLDDDYSNETWLLMQQLETIFKSSYLQHDFAPSNASSDECVLHSAALNAWGLLLTLMPTDDFKFLFSSNESFAP